MVLKTEAHNRNNPTWKLAYIPEGCHEIPAGFAADNPVADNPVADNPAADNPVADNPAADNSAVDNPAVDFSTDDSAGNSVESAAPVAANNFVADFDRCTCRKDNSPKNCCRCLGSGYPEAEAPRSVCRNGRRIRNRNSGIS